MFSLGTVFGFMISSIFPVLSVLFRTFVVRTVETIVTLGICMLVGGLSYKIFLTNEYIGSDKNNKVSLVTEATAAPVREAALEENDPLAKKEAKSKKTERRKSLDVAPSSEYAARPYPHYASKLGTSTRSTSDPVTSVINKRPNNLITSDVNGPNKRINISSPAPSQDSTSSYFTNDSEDAGYSSASSASPAELKTLDVSKKRTRPERAERTERRQKYVDAVSSSSNRDANKVQLKHAYIKLDPASEPKLISGVRLFLRINAEGLFLDDDSGARGGNLKTWMISSIETDISGSALMRVLTKTDPPIQIVYIFQEQELWKATLGLHALKRSAPEIQMREVDGRSILRDLGP
ncbi:hypothetical protein V1511DRAFT_462522 [Dipodascopsis uninucleata]